MKPVDEAISVLRRMEDLVDEIYPLFVRSYAKGLVLGDNGNLELLVELENKIPLLRGRLEKLRDE